MFALPAVQVADAGQAERLAARFAQSQAGVIAFSRTGDPSTGEYSDAVIIAAYGQIPNEVLEFRAVG